MKKMIPRILGLLCAVGTIATLEAGRFTNDFAKGVPAGSAVYGSAIADRVGGINNSPVLKLTRAVNSQEGSFVIEDLDAGAPVYGVTVDFKARVGGGTSTPADGFSFSFATDLPNSQWSEEGAGTGVTVAFDIFDNGGGEAPAVDLKFNNQTLVTRKVPISDLRTGAEFVPVHLEVTPFGFFNLAYNGKVLYTNTPVQGFTSISAGRFGFGGRTGGLNENQWIDDLQIETVLTSAVGILQQPQSVTALLGREVTLSVGINNPEGVTFQWFKNGEAIADATAATYTTPPLTLADGGTKYRAVVTGANNTATSDEATVDVVDIPLSATPKATFNFDDGLTPAGTAVFGTAFVYADGGVGDSGSLALTDALNDQNGAWMVYDLDAGAAVYGFSASFDMRVGGGTLVPADGFSFSFGPDIPDATFGEAENGVGTGLVVAFDIFDNGGGEAPSVDVKFGGQVLSSVKVPLSLLETGEDYEQVIVRLEADGTLDVVCDGIVLFNDFAVPGFSFFRNYKFALAARTGGLNVNHWVDNVTLSTELTPAGLRITEQPQSIVAWSGRPVEFSTEVSVAEGVTFQWFRNGAVITGATGPIFTVDAPAAADDGAKFKVSATQGAQTVTSDEAVLTVVNLTISDSPEASFNFDDGLVPAGTAVLGSARVDATGVLVLTDAINGQSGIFFIQPIEGGAELSGFTASFLTRVGGGTAPPADGFSFNFANDLASGTIGEAENGGGTGVTVAFDIFDNGGGEAPSIDIRYRGAVIASKKVPLPFVETGDAFVETVVRVEADGTLDLGFNDEIVFHNVTLPNYRFTSQGRFAWAARTGGLNVNHWIDDIKIDAVKSSGPLRFVVEPSSQVVLEGQAATFSAQVNDPAGVTYQWLRNDAPVPDATSATFSTAATTAADTGARYAIRAAGPGGTATSASAILTVVAPITITDPKLVFDFNDGLKPDNSILIGSARVDAFGGVNDSGVLKLTEAIDGQGGTFIIQQLDLDQPVGGFTAIWDMRVGGGTETPADGFSFVYAPDLDDFQAFGEDGSGSGLTISFDTFDNGNGEAPAIDVRAGGSDVASRKVPISALATGDAFLPVVVRVQTDGTLDVIYGSQVIYYDLAIPEYAPITGGRFAFGARTGGLNDNHFVDNLRIATTIAADQPRITRVQLLQGQIIVEWTGGGTLESAATIRGSWSDVPGSTGSPSTVNPTGSAQFFRVRR